MLVIAVPLAPLENILTQHKLVAHVKNYLKPIHFSFPLKLVVLDVFYVRVHPLVKLVMLVMN